MTSRIRYDQVSRHLQEKPSHCFYCVMGEELLLRNETIDLIRHHYRQLGFSERHSLVLDANGPWHKIQDHLQNTSLFAEQKILEITIPSGKPGRVGSAALIDLAQAVNQGQVQDATIILSLPKLDKKTQEAKWFKAIEASACIIDIIQIQRQHLPVWIQQRLAKQGQKIEPSALDFLVDRVEGNLFAAHQEILKLGLIHPEGVISQQSIEQAVSDLAKFDVFQLTDAMLTGDVARSLRILQSLEEEGEALPMVLSLVSREIRLLHSLCLAQLEKQSLSSLMNQLRIFSSRQTLFQKALQRLNYPKLIGLIQHASDIDRLFKGYPVEGRLLNAWEELKRLVLKTASNGVL